MTDSSPDIDFSLTNLWQSWWHFRAGKRPSTAISEFEYCLEENLSVLQKELVSSQYRHSDYEHFVVHDNKRREIAVANVRDRVVHRLLYDYLVPIFDKTFIYDAWSCRKGKGLHGAIDRAQIFTRHYQNNWLWRTDITKFFDSVDQARIKQLLRRRVHDQKALWLLDEVIVSYNASASKQGLPIGNLTSQIMANIYLNEFDRFVVRRLKPLAYMRYGDDFICFAGNKYQLGDIRKQATLFLQQHLGLTINSKVDVTQLAYKGISYLGVDIWPNGRRLQAKTRRRIKQQLNSRNSASYRALITTHENQQKLKDFDWRLLERIDSSL